MQETLYKLIFDAKIQPGFKEKTVKKNLQALFSADKEKMRRLFSGEPVIVRKNLPEDKVRQYEKAMIRAGACCRILSVKDGLELPPINPETLALISHSATTTPPVSEKSPKSTSTSHNRIGRIRFIALSWLVVAVEVCAWMAPDYLRQFFGNILTIQENIMLIAGLHTLAMLILITITGLRLHDLDRSAWLWVFLLIPGLNLLFLFWLSFARGSADQNAFGQIPSDAGSLARIFGLWIPLLLMVAVSGSAWFHQQALQRLAITLPGDILELINF